MGLLSIHLKTFTDVKCFDGDPCKIRGFEGMRTRVFIFLLSDKIQQNKRKKKKEKVDNF